MFDVVPILLSVAIAALVGLHVACGIRKAGVEHYGGRILILAAIADTAIIVVMLLLLGTMTLLDVLTPMGFSVADLTMAVLFLLLPVRIAWNYLKAPARLMRRLSLTPAGTEVQRGEVSAVAALMEIPVPAILSSPRCRMPFVFGRTSKRAWLALPNAWDDVDATSRHIMLCHELAHIRNLDVGFLTWSFAFLSDLKWAALLCPIVVALSFMGGREYLPQAAALYVICLPILWCLTHMVVRSRELLADATVAMLIDSGQIVRTFTDILLAPETGLGLGVGNPGGMIVRIRSWLADKTLFSEHRTIWKAITRFVELLLEVHPPVSTRRDAIRNRRAAGEDLPTEDSRAFWAGLPIGLLAVLIALGSFWTGESMLGWQDSKQIMLLSRGCWAFTIPLGGTLIGLFFVLPAWSSLRPHVPTRRSLARLLIQYLQGFLGASCVLPLILLGGWSHNEIRQIAKRAALLVATILAFGIVTNIVMLSLWQSARYRRRYFLTDLAGIFYSYGIGLLAIFGYLTYGFILVSEGRVPTGGSILSCLLVGLAAFCTVYKDSRVSGTDQYLVIAPPPVSFALEGRKYRRWSPLIGSLHLIGTGLGPAAVVSGIIFEVGDDALGQVDPLIAILAVLVVGCSAVMFLDWQWPRQMREVCRHKTCALVEAQVILHNDLSAESGRIISRILESWRVQYNQHTGFVAMTTQKIFELIMLASHAKHSRHPLWEGARKWAFACETATGFGVWPGSGPRLSSTYQCLQILRETGGIDLSDSSRHVAWIRSLQTPDGAFRGPWSYRSTWEDTFFATAALGFLESGLDAQARARCLAWLKRTLISEGIKKEQLSAFHYCLAATDALHGLDENIAGITIAWLSVELDRLLLTNVGHSGEDIRHAVCAYHLLEERGFSLEHPERIALLGDRINDALEAELAALRI